LSSVARNSSWCLQRKPKPALHRLAWLAFSIRPYVHARLLHRHEVGTKLQAKKLSQRRDELRKTRANGTDVRRVIGPIDWVPAPCSAVALAAIAMAPA
jgi:hypothetical protein